MKLISRTARLGNVLELTAVLPALDAFLWTHEGDGFIAFGEAARIDPGTGADRFLRAAASAEELFASASSADEVRRPGSGPVAFGSFTFDPETPGSRLVVPALTIGRSGDAAWLTVTACLDAPGRTGPPSTVASASWGGVGEDEWVRAVARVRDSIRGGWLAKVVLAREVSVSAAEPFEARPIAAVLARTYPACFTFVLDGLVGASPELLVRRTGDAVESLVLAGSAARGTSVGEDERLGAALFASAKERWEHELAVGTVTDVLAPACAEMKAEPEPSLLRLANVQHLSTSVHGELASPVSALALAGRLHPTAAVCGVPTSDALAVIRKTEGFDRGRYAGPVGWVDSRGDGEWAIALRCAELAGTVARLFAGNGIVAESDPAAELAETNLKLRAMRSAMGLD